MEEDILKASIASKEKHHMTENGQSKEPMTTKAEPHPGEAANMKIKKFVESMTPKDIQTLKVSNIHVIPCLDWEKQTKQNDQSFE